MGEREHLVRPENMATTSTAVSTVPQPLPEVTYHVYIARIISILSVYTRNGADS